jgi:hypothetical protein
MLRDTLHSEAMDTVDQFASCFSRGYSDQTDRGIAIAATTRA